ncbi:MAG: tRNA cyclic N6-threonylcarbamoyladenosine(37) synthase TcdA [Opitutaceae bacterium]
MKTDADRSFGGVARLYGRDGLERLRASHVCVIGIGGVGSWAAEALARSGTGRLTLIDLDEICETNLNRQVHALAGTVGQAKVNVMAERIRAINPACEVSARQGFFTAANADAILGEGFDHVVDAIDNVPNKCLLLARCRDLRIPVITAGAAGGRRDPGRVQTADLSRAIHDTLLARVRKILRRDFGFPRERRWKFKIDCVFSPEPTVYPQTDGSVCASKDPDSELRLDCDSGFGTAAFVTGAFGFALAAGVVNRIAKGKA